MWEEVKWKGETRHLEKVVTPGGDLSDSYLLKLYPDGGRGVMGDPGGGYRTPPGKKRLQCEHGGRGIGREAGAVKFPDSRVTETPQ